MRAFLGLGSNVGDRWAHLRRAAAALPDLVRISPVYETEPAGGPSGQDLFLNAVAELETSLCPDQLLDVCHRLEEEAGRVRTERNGPRTLDVDVLLLDEPATGQVTLDEPDLTLPHPRMWDRAFVLIPLADLAPDLVPHPPVDPSVRLAGRL
ncbi:MAG: 2-amino-4-hydroxy-6-hydroxymethyldihydropteridine diphosphokinase [Actinomycetota bacterium]|nr:2-amino-4-hydroxy-6-hydroxymethyldihydropteridine diphosphokinase [Actinomycetota bacterium]